MKNDHSIKITIIVPARDKADTLPHTLKTCLDQGYENLEVIVSDNCSVDNTPDLVRAIDDPRLKYIRTPRRLGMSQNYEFALQHVSSGYVSILGADDAYIPGAIQEIADLLKTTGVGALNWPSDMYVWPGAGARENFLKVSLKTGFEIHATAELKRRALNSSINYSELPWIYRGMVSIDAVRRTAARSGGNFFHSMIPDVYSGVALLDSVPAMGYSHRPFTIDGISPRSNGASYTSDDPKKTRGIAFLREDNLPYHPSVQMCLSGCLMQLESLLQARDCGAFAVEAPAEIDVRAYLAAALQQAARRDPDQYERVIVAVRFTAGVIGMSGAEVERMIAATKLQFLSERYNYNVDGYNIFKSRVELDLKERGITDIHRAAQLHVSIRNAPAAWRSPMKVLPTTVRLVYREIMRRLAS